MRRPGRVAVYAGAGYVFEVAFSALHDAARRKPVRLRTSPLMLSVYALLLPLYEPVHHGLRGRPLPLRASVYGLGFLAVEYATGSLPPHSRGGAVGLHVRAPPRERVDQARLLLPLGGGRAALRAPARRSDGGAGGPLVVQGAAEEDVGDVVDVVGD